MKKIRIGVHDFDVIADPVLKGTDGALGICNGAGLEIRYIPHRKRSVVRDTLVHEVFHAIFWAQGLKDLDDPALEERVVGAITPLFLDTVDRNPAFRNLVIGD